MEKIKLSNGQIFDLEPMGIITQNNKRIFTLQTNLTTEELAEIFSNPNNINRIQYILESGEVAVTYLDCAYATAITKSINSSGYTVEIATDVMGRRVETNEKNTTYIELALVEVYELLLGGI